MKLHRVTMYVIDYDGLGASGVKEEIEGNRWANHCMSPRNIAVDTVDIGEWSDEHPANQRSADLEDWFQGR